MSFDRPDAILVESLTRQEEVDTERPARPADRGEQLGEFRPHCQELSELVDDDHQGWKGIEFGIDRPPVVAILVGSIEAMRSKHALPTVHLTPERILHPIDESRIGFDVGD